MFLADDAPPKSKAEMAAMKEVEKLQTVNLPGTLGIHEECYQALAEAIQNFLDS